MPLLSHPVMGETFCLPISRLVLAKEVKAPPPSITSHFLVSRADSDPSEVQRSGNRNMFIVSSAPLGSLVWKASTVFITTTEWGMQVGAEREAVRRVLACQIH